MKTVKDWSKVNTNFDNPSPREQWLLRIIKEYKEYSFRKCECGKIATTQTVQGEDAEKELHLPRNYSWYCDKCYEKGLKLENEAIYG